MQTEIETNTYELQLRCCGFDFQLTYDRKPEDVEVHSVDGVEPSQEWIELILPRILDKLTMACYEAANEADKLELAEQKEWDNFTATHTYQ